MSGMSNMFSELMISNSAWAQAATPAPGGAPQIMQFLPIIFMLLVFYFLIIRPQTKKAKLHQEFLNTLKIGETVLTNSGIVGKIRDLQSQFVDLEVADGVRIRMVKSQVSGPLKNEEKK